MTTKLSEIYDFYSDHNAEGNVFAVIKPTIENYGSLEIANLAGRHPEGFAALFYRPNSPVASTGFSLKYINESAQNYGQITEEEARSIHPKLFERLDD